MIFGIIIGIIVFIILICIIVWIYNKNKKYNKGTDHYNKTQENIDVKTRINNILKTKKYKTDFDEIYFNYSYKDLIHQNRILYEELNYLLLQNTKEKNI